MSVHIVFKHYFVHMESSAMERNLSPKVHILEISVNKDDESKSEVYELLEHIRPHWHRNTINIDVRTTSVN